MFRKRLNSNSLCINLWLIKRLFVKIIPRSEYLHEIYGYEMASQYYPVPRLYLHFSLFGFCALIFQYEKSLDKLGGQVVDYFTWSSDDQDLIHGVFDMYRTVFKKTLTIRQCKQGEPSDIFYRNRINTRLLPWYKESSLQELEGVRVSFNGYPLKLQLDVLINEAQVYFSPKRVLPCVISQCDPQDLNLGTKPVVMDFRAGGHTPLMAEFASYLWFNLAMGNYLAPLLNPATYKNKPDIFEHLDKMECVQDSYGEWQIEHSLSERRCWAIKEYSYKVLKPLLTEYPTWFDDLMPHLTMRALTVFNLSQDKKNLLFVLAYIAHIRTIKTSDIDEFIENILRLYNTK